MILQRRVNVIKLELPIDLFNDLRVMVIAGRKINDTGPDGIVAAAPDLADHGPGPRTSQRAQAQWACRD